MTLSEPELMRAERELRSLEGSVSLVLLKDGDEKLESEMEEFAQRLANLSDGIKLQRKLQRWQLRRQAGGRRQMGGACPKWV